MTGKTLGVDENPHAHEDAKAVIQEVVWAVSKQFAGQNAVPQDVEVVLSKALADAGIPEQPARWVEATSIEIAGERDVILDVANQVEPDVVEVGDKEVTVLGNPKEIPDVAMPQPTSEERAAE